MLEIVPVVMPVNVLDELPVRQRDVIKYRKGFFR